VNWNYFRTQVQILEHEKLFWILIITFFNFFRWFLCFIILKYVFSLLPRSSWTKIITSLLWIWSAMSLDVRSSAKKMLLLELKVESFYLPASKHFDRLEDVSGPWRKSRQTVCDTVIVRTDVLLCERHLASRVWDWSYGRAVLLMLATPA
jgi:hypothetical protein